MTTTMNPYLNFRDGLAREALEFYRSVFGGDLSLMTFGDMGTEGPLANQIMHGQLVTSDGQILMGADAPEEMVQVTYGDNVSVSLSGDDGVTLRAWFDALSVDATVTMPLDKQVWGDEFGSLVDRYGISWLVNIAGS